MRKRDEKGRWPVVLKHCPRCDRDLPSSYFGKDISTKDGKKAYCKECVNKETRAYQLRMQANYPELFRERRNKTQRTFKKSARGKYWALKYGARKTGASFDIDKEEFVSWYEKQKQECYYCGLPFNGKYHYDPLARTIDRKDNSKGYALDNIVLACRRCNTVKGSWFTEQEMKEIAQKYLKNRCGGALSKSI